ncbi:hypothetical protein A2852_02615 [Candidatus Adlerbacteria bacterium RIFCSPHIGHO2_01_FULL_54_23]|uniref:Uncharacterized protein n=3 Tax=Candidatus Adleribacteriota TaxID=1752736 RepID=A0A1F4Y173_9BACT|nr:MAG: hypothetical protein UY83_C0002G0003 [Candidatus Adlerbacteria bacterium GW2011_GWA1_54_10]KKW38011.1 MAG: hypothetical protein UY86_C0002G0108 [Candidatus Adlerbacteria bacterium GW2011_GWB1_54_7]OGC78617.1 MAG: hypothetical protein A2852_02615 [Candidatus Adlerbacteria bacterium RIFCSPHIGHO2_01_FULL_54_23]OGC87624.1 MAG: hypothetical protein A3B33_01810 [Candidatus Adlerbacteria bacterium RIFCSPLOWO2_01_FULL_54_16]
MTLTTHALVGTAAAALFPAQPYLAFSAAFASHFAIDAIPHWDYGKWLLRSIVEDKVNPLATDMIIGKDFMRDLIVIGADAALGVAASLFIFSFWLFAVPPEIVLIGVVAGILPDPLQFVYYKTRWFIFEPLQRFHIWIQWKQLEDIPPPLGAGLQAALVAIVVWAEKLFL